MSVDAREQRALRRATMRFPSSSIVDATDSSHERGRILLNYRMPSQRRGAAPFRDVAYIAHALSGWVLVFSGSDDRAYPVAVCGFVFEQPGQPIARERYHRSCARCAAYLVPPAPQQQARRTSARAISTPGLDGDCESAS